MSKLSIITASHRNPDGLISLYNKIKPVICSDINWIIKDSGKCEITRLWGSSISDPNINFICENDYGIYNALNYALSHCQSDFYLVVGSDDLIDTGSFLKIKEMLFSDAFNDIDIATFPILINGRISKKKWLRPIFISVSGLVSSHSVGTIIRRNLHDSVGKYDESYQILADAFFIRLAHQSGARFKCFKSPTIGSFSITGVSSTQHARRILEAYSYNVACGDSPFLQALLLFARIIKYKPLTFT